MTHKKKFFLNNKIEDFFSFMFITFRRSKNLFEYFDVSYYFKAGHYKNIKSTLSFDDELFNSREISLVRYFNALIYFFYNNQEKFLSLKEKMYLFLDLLQNSDHSIHHDTFDGAIYLKNNYSHLTMQKGWIGALPQLRLLSLIMILKEEKYYPLLKKVIASIYEPSRINNKGVFSSKYNFINNISSIKDKTMLVHEYPADKNNLVVINCLLLFAAINDDLIKSKIICQNDLTRRALFFLDKNLDSVTTYSIESKNPISPAYYDLQSSIINSSNLARYNSKFIRKLTTQTSRISLFFKKIFFRATKGY